jgi:hypothetical protein
MMYCIVDLNKKFSTGQWLNLTIKNYGTKNGISKKIHDNKILNEIL